MKPIIYLSLLAFAACGVRRTSVDFGKTTSAQLIAEKGEPTKITDAPIQDTKIYQYPENEKFQLKDDVVTHGLKDPIGDEVNVIFWKHKFKDCATVTRKISDQTGHLPPQYEMKCDSQGVSVIYTQGSDYVSRVIQYAKN
jgi:hypothetical protein